MKQEVTEAVSFRVELFERIPRAREFESLSSDLMTDGASCARGRRGEPPRFDAGLVAPALA